jgi:hypothetical protein
MPSVFTICIDYYSFASLHDMNEFLDSSDEDDSENSDKDDDETDFPEVQYYSS